MELFQTMLKMAQFSHSIAVFKFLEPWKMGPERSESHWYARTTWRAGRAAGGDEDEID
jgi:hypothetical protein